MIGRIFSGTLIAFFRNILQSRNISALDERFPLKSSEVPELSTKLPLRRLIKKEMARVEARQKRHWRPIWLGRQPETLLSERISGFKKVSEPTYENPGGGVFFFLIDTFLRVLDRCL